MPLWAGLSLGAFLVSVPVALQAPLVRYLPVVSLVATGLLWLVGAWLLRQPRWQVYGDLLLGFSWSWLAGSIYWGWFRGEPLLHLPIEAIALPFALFALWRGWLVVGQCFYLGSLLGTVITDLYFYSLDLIPYWRRLMTANVEDSLVILQEAGTLVMTGEGLLWGLFFLSLIAGVARLALSSRRLEWWVFAGAVLGTLFVDTLFGSAALL